MATQTVWLTAIHSQVFSLILVRKSLPLLIGRPQTGLTFLVLEQICVLGAQPTKPLPLTFVITHINFVCPVYKQQIFSFVFKQIVCQIIAIPHQLRTHFNMHPSIIYWIGKFNGILVSTNKFLLARKTSILMMRPIVFSAIKALQLLPIYLQHQS